MAQFDNEEENDENIYFDKSGFSILKLNQKVFLIQNAQIKRDFIY